MDGFSPCGDCCCKLNSISFTPDKYRPDVSCLVTVIANVTVRTEVVTITRRYDDDGKVIETTRSDPDSTTQTIDSTTTTIDQVPAFGRHSHEFVDLTSAPSLGTESEQGEDGITTQVETTTVTNGTVEVQRRLTVKFDVSDQLLFGAFFPQPTTEEPTIPQPDAVPRIHSAHVGFILDDHDPDEIRDFVPDALDPNTPYSPEWSTAGVMSGFSPECAFPATVEQFDDRARPHDAAFSGDEHDPIDVTEWLPQSQTDCLSVYFYVDDDDTGGRLSDVVLSMADRELPFSGYALDMDWRATWTQIKDGHWVSKSKYGPNDVAFGLSGFNDQMHLTQYAFARMAFVADDDPPSSPLYEIRADATVSQQTNNNKCSVDYGDDEYVRRWVLGGSWGIGQHTSVTNDHYGPKWDEEYNLITDTPILQPLWIALSPRSALSQPWRQVQEGAVDVLWQWTPLSIDAEDTNTTRFHVEVEIFSDYKRAPTVSWHKILQPDDERPYDLCRFGCFPSDPRIKHLPWRLISATLPGGLPTTMTSVAHNGCDTAISTRNDEPFRCERLIATRTQEQRTLWYGDSTVYHSSRPTQQFTGSYATAGVCPDTTVTNVDFGCLSAFGFVRNSTNDRCFGGVEFSGCAGSLNVVIGDGRGFGINPGLLPYPFSTCAQLNGVLASLSNDNVLVASTCCPGPYQVIERSLTYTEAYDDFDAELPDGGATFTVRVERQEPMSEVAQLPSLPIPANSPDLLARHQRGIVVVVGPFRLHFRLAMDQSGWVYLGSEIATLSAAPDTSTLTALRSVLPSGEKAAYVQGSPRRQWIIDSASVTVVDQWPDDFREYAYEVIVDVWVTMDFLSSASERRQLIETDEDIGDSASFSSTVPAVPHPLAFVPCVSVGTSFTVDVVRTPWESSYWAFGCGGGPCEETGEFIAVNVTVGGDPPGALSPLEDNATFPLQESSQTLTFTYRATITYAYGSVTQRYRKYLPGATWNPWSLPHLSFGEDDMVSQTIIGPDNEPVSAIDRISAYDIQSETETASGDQTQQLTPTYFEQVPFGCRPGCDAQDPVFYVSRRSTTTATTLTMDFIDGTPIDEFPVTFTIG